MGAGSAMHAQILADQSYLNQSWQNMPTSKFFIMSTEFDKNISDRRYDRTDRKNGFDFFMRLTKWPKIAVKKCQNLIFKVNFQCQKSSESLSVFLSLKNTNPGAHFLLLTFFDEIYL